jgi:hypothetical protein
MRTSHAIFSAALLTAVLGTTTACAAHASVFGYPDARVRVDNRAFQIGFDEGRDRGFDDARRGRRYDYDRHRAFRNADQGYRGNGSRGAYRDAFRQGFINGYDTGYRGAQRGGGTWRQDPVYGDRNGPGYGGGRGPVYNSRAGQIGYEDGYSQGRDDARDRDPYDPIRSSRYREGDRGYDRRDGPVEVYKRDYRAAFQQGYQAGYQQNRR